MSVFSSLRCAGGIGNVEGEAEVPVQSGKATAAPASMMPVGVLLWGRENQMRGGLFRAALWSLERSTHLVKRPLLEMSPKYMDELIAQILLLQPISPILLHLTFADPNPQGSHAEYE